MQQSLEGNKSTNKHKCIQYRCYHYYLSEVLLCNLEMSVFNEAQRDLIVMRLWASQDG